MPDGVLLGARLLLAAVFALAGLSKLRDRAGSREALEGFGLPEGLAPIPAILLPLSELVVAAALIPAGTARVGAAGALALLGLFSVAIAVNLARGNTPDCHCFGRVHSGPIGAGTLVRNGALTAIAMPPLLWGPGPGPGEAVSWIGDLSRFEVGTLAGGLALLLLAAIQGWFILQLLRQQGRLLLRMDTLEGRGEQPGLPIGSAAPAFSLLSLSGETRTLEALVEPGLPAVLVFTSTRCGPCRALLPELGRWQRDHARTARVVVVVGGEEAAARSQAAEHRLDATWVLLEDRGVADAYRVDATPTALLVDAGGRIGSALAVGPDAIRRLTLRATDALPGPEVHRVAIEGHAARNGARAPGLDPAPARDRPAHGEH